MVADYKEETIRSYNENASNFSEKFKDLMDIKRRHEFSRFAELLPGKDILDLGAGAGDHAYYFSELGLNVTAVDLSEEMIKLCRQKGLNAILMDIEDLKFKDKTFDGIWAVTSLLHIPKSKLQPVVNKLYDTLKKDGILYICIKKGNGEGLVKDKDSGTCRFFAYWEKEEFLRLFDKFILVESSETALGARAFLDFFFKRK